MGEEMERGQGSTTKPTEKSSYIRTEKNPLDLAMNRLFGGNLQCQNQKPYCSGLPGKYLETVNTEGLCVCVCVCHHVL